MLGLLVAATLQASPGPSIGDADVARAKAASVACATVDASRHVMRVGQALCIRAALTADTYAEFAALNPSGDDVVVASGPGGEAPAGMNIGDVIRARGMSVVVDDICVSSCAYFIALGGPRLYLVNKGILGFHGGPIPDETIDKDDRFSDPVKAKLKAENRRFVTYFAQRDLDVRITNDVPAALRGQNIDWTMQMWVRKGPELAAYGFKGLAYCDSKLGC